MIEIDGHVADLGPRVVWKIIGMQFNLIGLNLTLAFWWLVTRIVPRVRLAPHGERRSRRNLWNSFDVAHVGLRYRYRSLLAQEIAQAGHRLCVKLVYAGLAHAEHLADFLKGQALEVVERDDEALAIG